MWDARTKTDLVIEVWEKLDCESVGAVEIEAIEQAVIGHFGEGAADSPMSVARLLADEGAVLRHSEILDLHFRRNAGSIYDAIFRNLIRIGDLGQARSTFRQLEALRKKFEADKDRKGLSLLREAAIEAKNAAEAIAGAGGANRPGEVNAEIAEWFRIWLLSPEVFAEWILTRTASEDFRTRFGEEFEKNGTEGEDS